MVSKKKVPDQRKHFKPPISKDNDEPLKPHSDLKGIGYPKRIHDGLVILVFVSLATLLYVNSFQVPFHFDDRPNIVDNRGVHLHTFTLDHFRRLLTFSFSESIRFFSYFTFALNFYFGKLNVFGYHLVNLLIHIATGILVFWFVRLTLTLPSQRERYQTVASKVAFVTGLIFIAHPVQTQAVTYIVQRMTSMAAMFYLLSMVLYVKGRQSVGKRRFFYYGAMGISGFLSIFSKENAFVLPLFIALYEILFFRQGWRNSAHRPMIKILILLVSIGLIGFILLGGKYIDTIQEGYQYRDFKMSERVLTQFRVVLYYLSLLIFPHPSRLNLDYDFPISRTLFDPISTVLSLMVILFLIGIGIWKMKKFPVLSFFIFWYFGNLAIESSFIPLEMVYEHRLYLPSIGPFFLFSLLLIRIWEKWAIEDRWKRESVLAGLLILIILPLSWATIQRNSIWRSGDELWRDAAKKSPHKGRPHYNLGTYYYQRGETAKAQEEFETALKLDPKMAPAYFNMGVIYYNKGLLDEATSHFKKAIELYPKYAQAYIHLGEIYERKGKRSESLAAFEKALKIDPYNVQGLSNEGVASLKQGDLDQAIIKFKEALTVDPNHFEAHVNLAEVYVRKGSVDQALLEIRQAIVLNPNHGDAQTTLGIILLQKGKLDDAISAFLNALKVDSNDIPALTNLGVAYRYKGLIDEAITQFKKVLNIRPNDEEAHIYLGEAYLVKGKINEAIQESEKVLQLNPQALAARVNLGQACFQKGRVDQAILEWKKALEINPKEAKVHHSLAAAYYAKKEFRLALKHLDEAAALGFRVHPQLAEWLKPYR